MLEEFKKFAMRGNVLDLAVGVIIGASFTGIVTSLVNDIIMPPIGKAMGGVNFADLFINLDPSKLAKDGSANASGGRVTFADGRQVFTASTEDSAPK